jgi:hypothetical protein
MEPTPKRTSYVTDSQAIISVQGLRLAKKCDRKSFGEERFDIEAHYKHQNILVSYNSKEERDSTFEALKTLL